MQQDPTHLSISNQQRLPAKSTNDEKPQNQQPHFKLTDRYTVRSAAIRTNTTFMAIHIKSGMYRQPSETHLSISEQEQKETTLLETQILEFGL